uniref:Apoptosis-promoting Bax1 inhibitor n=1 Tax=uncultured bacterium pA1 TaxID=1776268 RepID=A0A0U3UF35_9BACT|nr:apoptosis-promoting Bax1 inhibitor [uncultured bacterium pA1]
MANRTGSLSASVWERTSASHAMSKNLFAFLVSFWTAAGIASSAVAATFTTGWHPTIWPLLGLSIIPFVGILIALKSDNPVVSLFGYMLVTIPFGLIVGPVVAMYTAASVAKVFMITTAMVVVLGIVGAVYPKSLESWGIWLFGALLILIFGQFGVMIAGAFGVNVGGAMTLLDWVGVVLFSGYVIYDLNRAMRVERTHDNAIDCAVAVYLDFANLFIRLLSLMGDRKSSD